MGRRNRQSQSDPAPVQLSRKAHPVRLGFDSAKTTDDNRNHWAAADALSADATLTPDVRRTLRNRCRYETLHLGMAPANPPAFAFSNTVYLPPADMSA